MSNDYDLFGHLFDDGAVAPGGRRYGMNSAALRFAPAAEPEGQGYGRFRARFETSGTTSAEESA